MSTDGQAGEFDVIFQLEPQWVGADRMPTDNWHESLTPVRDSTGDELSVVSLRIPMQVRQNSELGRIFRVPAGDEREQQVFLDRLAQTRGVAWAEPNPIRYTCGTSSPGRDAPPGDPYYPLQWSLERIHAAAAWDISRGDTSVTIAVIDVGVDIDHNDLIQQLWTNWPEANGTPGVDDDGNGFVDDIHGWDFRDDDADPRPADGARQEHGTHVAGIACAAVDNRYGIAGVGWNCRLMSIRAGYGNAISFGYEGLVYAVAAGADVISLSWGSGTPSNVERITTEYAGNQGVVIVAAAGNFDVGSGTNHYPAAYPDVIGVAATTQGDLMALFSNYGPWVNISAPGDEIISTYPHNQFGLASGTSMATPIVAGAAGLLKALHPGWTPAQIRQQLILSADPLDDLNPHVAGQLGGRLNLYRALSDSRAGFTLVEVIVDDETEGNGNGVIDPGERLRIVCVLENLLTEAAEITGVISSSSTSLNIVTETAQFSLIEPGNVGANAETPFQITVSRNALSGSDHEVKLDLFDDDREIQSLHLRLTVRPSLATHSNSNIACTVTNFGAIGYYDYITGDGRGEGFRFPASGLSTLFHGSLFLATPPDLVSDCAYGNADQDQFDFVSESGAVVLQEDGSDLLLGVTEYSDANAETPLRVMVRQYSYTYASPVDEDYLILSYVITNQSNASFDSLYVGLFLDWDIIQADINIVRWDEESNCGWMEYRRENHPIFGAALLDKPTSFHVALDNRITIRGWSDQEKLDWMLRGFEQSENSTPDDYTQFIGTGPHRLTQRDSLRVSFVLAAGSDEADFRVNIQAARDRWGDEATMSDHPPATQGLELISVSPDPFNESTVISFHSFGAGSAVWRLFDINGRLIIPSQQIHIKPGVSSLPITARNLPTGRYMFKLKHAENSLIVPLTVTR